MLDQSRNEHKVAALVRRVWVTRRAAVCANEEPKRFFISTIPPSIRESL
jgi:hypothetical protein